MERYSNCDIKCLSISEISRVLLKELRKNEDFSFIDEIENILLKKGLRYDFINHLFIEELSKLILGIDEISKFVHYYNYELMLNDLVKKYENYNPISDNKKVYRVKVSLDQVDDKIYRVYDITGTSKLSLLAYAIMGSFNTLAYHLYWFRIKGNNYDCGVCRDWVNGYEFNSKKYSLNSLFLQKGDKFVMEYDSGCGWEFNIEVIDILEKEDKKYPYIIEGKGKGIVEDEGYNTLFDFIKAKDEGRKTLIEISEDEYYEYDFDYTEFDLDKLNNELPNEIRKIKRGWDKGE